MKSPEGMHNWIHSCMHTVLEVCEFKPTDPNDPDPSELLEFWFELMYKSMILFMTIVLWLLITFDSSRIHSYAHRV